VNAPRAERPQRYGSKPETRKLSMPGLIAHSALMAHTFTGPAV
jgi:hypothetical protein